MSTGSNHDKPCQQLPGSANRSSNGVCQPTLSRLGRVQPLPLYEPAFADTPDGLWPLAELSGLERFCTHIVGLIFIKM